MPTIHVPDISEYQRSVAWRKVVTRNGGAAIIRAYNGHRADYTWFDKARHQIRRLRARRAGVKVLGIYAYAVATRPIDVQAREFVALVKKLRPGEFAVLDLEEGSGNLLRRAQAWFAIVDKELTYPGYHLAWLYSGEDFYRSHGLLPIAKSKRHTWVAAYGASEPTDVPHTLWQHTSEENWPGIGRCDCSIFHGTLAQLAAKVWTPPKPAKPAGKPAAKATPAAKRPADYQHAQRWPWRWFGWIAWLLRAWKRG